MELAESCFEDKFLPVMFNGVPEEFRLKAKIELNETDENVRRGLAILKDYIRKHNLPFATSESFLMMFLRSSKFDFKKAEERVKRFVKVWKEFCEEQKDIDMDTFRALIDHHMIGLLPYRDSQGRVVLYLRANAGKEGLYDMNDTAMGMFIFWIFIALNPLTSISGVITLFDCYVDSVYEYYPIFNAFRKYAKYSGCLPFRLWSMDFVNDHYLCRCFFVAIKPFLPAKIRNRVKFHGTGFGYLLKEYPPSMLPIQFGGTLGQLRTDSYKEKFLEFIQSLKNQINHNGSVKIAV